MHSFASSASLSFTDTRTFACTGRREPQPRAVYHNRGWLLILPIAWLSSRCLKIFLELACSLLILLFLLGFLNFGVSDGRIGFSSEQESESGEIQP
jgi:hypothetical protein